MLGRPLPSGPGVADGPRSARATTIAGVYIVEPDIHGDERGIFIETYRREWFPQGREMIQANRADRQAGAVVGLHYHLHQADYWYVPFGRARVVLHDLRVGSPTEGKTMSFDLGARADGTHDHPACSSRPGVAHGFASLTDMTITYLVDGYYNPADELGVAWDDPEIGGRLGRRPSPCCQRPRPATIPAVPNIEPRLQPRVADAHLRRAHAHPRHRRRRLHRLQLRPLRARQHRRRGHRLRRAHLRRQPRRRCATSTTTRATRS